MMKGTVACISANRRGDADVPLSLKGARRSRFFTVFHTTKMIERDVRCVSARRPRSLVPWTRRGRIKSRKLGVRAGRATTYELGSIERDWEARRAERRSRWVKSLAGLRFVQNIATESARGPSSRPAPEARSDQ